MLKQMAHTGIVVDDLDAAIGFFTALGLELEGTGTVEGKAVDQVNGLRGVRGDIAMLRTEGGVIELCQYRTPETLDGDAGAPPNTLGLRHIGFEVDSLDGALDRLRPHGAELVGEVAQYEDSWRLCYVRGPVGVIVELAQRL